LNYCLHIRIYDQYFKVICLPHKFSMFNSAEKCGTQGVIVSWLTSKGMFSLFIAFEGVDSEKII